MPRGPRLDAPGTLHHVMVRGIERRTLFRDTRDREDFVRRLAALAARGALRIYAWALLPHHPPRRYRRVGHLFQNRYKSIVVEEEPYFLELVRYLHLNPLRAGVVADLRALARYPYSGHTALCGQRAYAWQETPEVLGRFRGHPRRARAAYQAFVAAGVRHGRRPELQGGGLVRSAGGWAAVRALRRGRERSTADERILGSSAFVDGLRRAVEAQQRAPRPGLALPALLHRVGTALGVSPAALRGGGRRPALCRAREGIAYLWIEAWGHSGRQLAALLGVRPQSVYAAARRGREARARWDRLVPGGGK